MSVNLDLYCDRERRYPAHDISVPFSLNGHTYASDGHIAVRVPRRPDIPENKEAPNVEERLSWDFSRIKLGPMPEPELLPDRCGWCGGRGKEHQCPSCCCECKYCKGSGALSPRVRIGNVTFDAQYIEWLQALEGLEIGKPKPSDPLPFRFKGGEGLLMPMNR